MKAMKKDVFVNSVARFIPYVIYTLWVLLYHKYMNLAFGDDVANSALLAEKNLLDVVIDCYNGWQSRIGIIFVMPIIEYYPWVFLVLDVFINISIMYMIIKIFRLNDTIERFLLLSLLLMFNIHDMSSAGWMTTIINYLWPVAALLLLIVLLQYRYSGVKNLFFIPVSFLILFFISTHEQCVVILISMYLIYLFLYYQQEKKIDMAVLSFVIVCCLCVFLILLSPGNANRMQAEMLLEWSSPLYAENSFLDKVWLGIIRFHAMFLAAPQIWNHSNFMSVPDHHLSYAFSLILIVHCFCIRDKKLKPLDVLLAITPFFVLLCYLLASFIPFFSYVFSQPGMPFVIDYLDWRFYSPVIFSILFVASFVTYIYRNFNLKYFTVIFVLLLSGLATQVMMGLTPSIYRSGARTSIFLYFILLMLAIYLFRDMNNRVVKRKTYKYVVYGLISSLFALSIYDCIGFFLFLAPRGY